LAVDVSLWCFTLCRCFFLEAYPQKRHLLEKLDADTYFAPFATSLRMSGLGYQSDAQADLFVCYNRLPTYLETLKQAIKTPYQPYEVIGLKDTQGNFKQMSTHILQIENEYYSDIRPKRSTVLPGEKPIHALASKGVEYIEVRSLDLNPYAPNGLSLTQMHFLELFMQFCALRESPLMDDARCHEAQQNLKTVVNEGRKPGLVLHREGEVVAMKDWAGQLLDEIFQLARCLDEQRGSGSERQQAVENQQHLLNDVNNTLSAKVIEDTTQAGSFQSFGLRQSEILANRFHPLTKPIKEAFEVTAMRSLEQQIGLEAAPRIEFETFLRDYLAGF
jgi:glutamate--cysteine ligase